MMRSLFSGVAGLRTHQTRMDVIGNNIANVNTTAYKSQSMVFSDLLYQTTQAASGANAATGRGGVNARQIGLGAKTGAISTAIAQQGSAQSTNNPWDVMINGDSFFVVSDGKQNFFTRDGSFKVDGAGNLVMSSTGYTVMGWQVDPETGEILQDTVSALRVMSDANLTYPPEWTTQAYVTGIVDKLDPSLNSTAGKIVTLSFFDNLGYAYTAKFSIHSLGADGQYYVQLDDILDEDGKSLTEVYNVGSINEIANFGSSDTIPTTKSYSLLDTATYTPPADGSTTGGTYSMKYVPANILDGYGSSQLINAATKGTLEIVLDDGKDVAVDDDVTVKGQIHLSKNELTQSPFNLLYSAIEVDTGEDDENGDPIMKTEYHYVGSSGQLADDAPAGGTGDTSLSDWTKALQKSFKGVDVKKVTVNADGSLDMDFEQKFAATKAGKYDKANNYFEGDKITDPLEAYGLANTDNKEYTIEFTAPDGQAQITEKFSYTGNLLVYDTQNGKFSYVGNQNNDAVTLNFNDSATSRTGDTVALTHYSDISIDFSLSSNVNNGGKSTAEMTSGDKEGNNIGAGRKTGEMTGVEIAQDGKITAYYDNNQSKLLGQIAVANFANPSGLSKQGNNLYSSTANSGEFDGVGDDITENGGSMESGVLEMSNVDLSSEFTEMITTQRGFQANSRIITVSDSLLEELISLKR